VSAPERFALVDARGEALRQAVDAWCAGAMHVAEYWLDRAAAYHRRLVS
jgi:hypothetical protein